MADWYRELVSYLEFNVPFQHKYGYIRDDGIVSGDMNAPCTMRHCGCAVSIRWCRLCRMNWKAVPLIEYTSRRVWSPIHMLVSSAEISSRWMPFLTRDFSEV